MLIGSRGKKKKPLTILSPNLTAPIQSHINPHVHVCTRRSEPREEAESLHLGMGPGERKQKSPRNHTIRLPTLANRREKKSEQSRVREKRTRRERGVEEEVRRETGRKALLTSTSTPRPTAGTTVAAKRTARGRR